MNQYFGLIAFYKQGLDKIIALDIRWIFISIIILFNAFFILFVLIKSKGDNQKDKILLLSVSSLLFFSSAIHTYDIFRIATGSIVGVIPIIFFLKGYKKYFFIYASVPMLFSLVVANSGNAYAPTKNYFQQVKNSPTPAIFYGQYWNPEIAAYYLNIQNSLMEINGYQCGIKFHHNHTLDAFLQVISPFKQLQMAPYYLFPAKMRSLRPELDTLNSLDLIYTKIILFEELKGSLLSAYVPPKHYKIHSIHPIKKNEYNDVLLILIPITCL